MQTEAHSIFFAEIARGNLEEVEALLDRVDVNATNQRGQTALEVACAYGYELIVEALLAAGATVSGRPRV